MELNLGRMRLVNTQISREKIFTWIGIRSLDLQIFFELVARHSLIKVSLHHVTSNARWIRTHDLCGTNLVKLLGEIFIKIPCPYQTHLRQVLSHVFSLKQKISLFYLLSFRMHQSNRSRSNK